MEQVEPLQPEVSLPVLVWVFLRAGATAFGDTGPLLAFIERDLVEDRRVLTREDITEALTYTQLLPGSTVVQIVAYLAYKLAGWPGAAACTLAYVLPAATAMAVLAAGYITATALPAIAAAVQGLTAAVVGILLATAYRLARRNVRLSQPITFGLMAIAFLGAFFGVNAALTVIGGGIVGVLLLSPSGSALQERSQ